MEWQIFYISRREQIIRLNIDWNVEFYESNTFMQTYN